MQIIPAFHFADRDSRKPRPNWLRGPSLYKPPDDHTIAVFTWTKLYKHTKLILVDPYGVCDLGRDTPTNDEGSTTAPRSFWTTSYNTEGAGNALIAEASMKFSCEVLAFIGAPARYTSKHPAIRLDELARATTELYSFMLRFPRVRLIIDTGGWLIGSLDNPLTSLLADRHIRQAIDLEGLRYQSDARTWPSTIWLGIDEISELFAPATIPPNVSGWIQGSLENQKSQLEVAKRFRLATVCLEPTVWGDQWNEMYDEMTKEGE